VSQSNWLELGRGAVWREPTAYMTTLPPTQSLRLCYLPCRLHSPPSFLSFPPCSGGRVVEYDTPAALLANPSSAFAALVRESHSHGHSHGDSDAGQGSGSGSSGQPQPAADAVATA
jgi:hypothetical protein